MVHSSRANSRAGRRRGRLPVEASPSPPRCGPSETRSTAAPSRPVATAHAGTRRSQDTRPAARKRPEELTLTGAGGGFHSATQTGRGHYLHRLANCRSSSSRAFSPYETLIDGKIFHHKVWCRTSWEAVWEAAEFDKPREEMQPISPETADCFTGGFTQRILISGGLSFPQKDGEFEVGSEGQDTKIIPSGLPFWCPEFPTATSFLGTLILCRMGYCVF